MDVKERISEILSKVRSFHIVVIGCGGTGSNLVPHLAQLVYSILNREGKKPDIRITLVDQDQVEPQNVGRQFFIQPEVGDNKAAILQRRYGNAFGLDIRHVPYYIQEEEMLINLLTEMEREYHNTLPILISCVDNHFSRQIMHKVFVADQIRDLIYLDAGNSLYAGQVVMGMKHNNEVLLKPVAEHYPDVLTTKDAIEVGGTCTRNVVKQPQTLVANLWAATILLTYLNNIIIERKVPAYMATFNGQNTLVRPEYI